jgi:hypothetical protein
MTRTLLACGVLAGPLYMAVYLGQALTRPGFDITRHPALFSATETWAGSRWPTSWSAVAW